MAPAQSPSLRFPPGPRVRRAREAHRTLGARGTGRDRQDRQGRGRAGPRDQRDRRGRAPWNQHRPGRRDQQAPCAVLLLPGPEDLPNRLRHPHRGARAAPTAPAAPSYRGALGTRRATVGRPNRRALRTRGPSAPAAGGLLGPTAPAAPSMPSTAGPCGPAAPGLLPPRRNQPGLPVQWNHRPPVRRAKDTSKEVAVAKHQLDQLVGGRNEVFVDHTAIR